MITDIATDRGGTIGFGTIHRKESYVSQVKCMVVEQTLIQSTSDVFPARIKDPLTGIKYYWQQLKDTKGSFDLDHWTKPNWKNI